MNAIAQVEVRRVAACDVATFGPDDLEALIGSRCGPESLRTRQLDLTGLGDVVQHRPLHAMQGRHENLGSGMRGACGKSREHDEETADRHAERYR